MVDLGVYEEQVRGEAVVGACFVEGRVWHRGADQGVYLLPDFRREVEESEGLEGHGRSRLCTRRYRYIGLLVVISCY